MGLEDGFNCLEVGRSGGSDGLSLAQMSADLNDP